MHSFEWKAKQFDAESSTKIAICCMPQSSPSHGIHSHRLSSLKMNSNDFVSLKSKIKEKRRRNEQCKQNKKSDQ